MRTTSPREAPRGLLCRRTFDDAAVEHVDLAVGEIRVARIVRDHADRRAASCSSWSSSITASPFFESRLPVGSSASRIDGLAGDARARRRRAAAGRRESCAGIVLHAMRHADALERLRHARRLRSLAGIAVR